MTKYSIPQRKGIDDLKSLFAFHGNSQGDDSVSNDIGRYNNSEGWMSFIFDCPLTQEAIDAEILKRKEYNEKYISNLKMEGEYGKLFEISVTLINDPLYDEPLKPNNSPTESYRMTFLNLNDNNEKIETLAEYQQLAARTCVDLANKQEDLLHMNFGIVTEIGEFLDPIKKQLAYKKSLDIVNLGEELADMCWYIANKARIFFPLSWEQLEAQGEGFKQAKEEYDRLFLPLFAKYSREIRTAFLMQTLSPETDDYDIAFTKEEFAGIKDIVIINSIAEDWGIDLFQALTNNIAKLQVRYPEKFTEEAALNRNLGAERIELEK